SGDFLLVTVEGTINGTDPGELVWIDPVTDKITKRMTIGPAPNHLAVTPDGAFAYVPVNDGHWEVIDLAKAKIVKRIRVGGRPHNTVCSADGKRMFLAPMGEPKRVTVVDVATHKPVGEIPFSDVVRPIALSRDGKRLYAEVDNLIGIEVADVDSRRMIHRVPAELTDEQKKIKSRSHGVEVHPNQKEVWECDLSHQVVHVYDVTGDRPKQTATVPIGGDVYWLTFSPDGKTCYVSVLTKDEVAVVDTATKKVTSSIPVGKSPKRLLVVPVKEVGK